jgi:hypothetical protein
MPVIPAWLVRSNLNDPRKIPYLLVWKDERDGEIKHSVRLAHFTACGRERNDYAELKRTFPAMHEGFFALKLGAFLRFGFERTCTSRRLRYMRVTEPSATAATFTSIDSSTGSEVHMAASSRALSLCATYSQFAGSAFEPANLKFINAWRSRPLSALSSSFSSVHVYLWERI